MATNDLTNKEQMIYDYVKEALRLEFPEADLNDNGEFMEMFGLAHVKLLSPLMNFADRITLMQSIENADKLSTDEMDIIAQNKYVARERGERSVGTTIFVFDDVPASGNLIIRTGTEVRSKQSYLFRTFENISLTLDELVNYYDPSSFRYRIPVLCESLEFGSKYNVAAGDIVEIVSDSIPNLEYVTNETNFTQGIDEQTNVELAEKIREEAFAPNLGNIRGYKAFIKGFQGVEDVCIAGYGHPLMQRDIIGEFTNPGFFNQTVRKLHWGTKVDAYIRGANIVTETEVFTVEKINDNELGVLLTKKPVRDVLSVRLYSASGEYDDPDIDPDSLYIMKHILEKEEDKETMGTLLEKVHLILQDERLSVGTTVQVVYRYNALIEEIHTNMYEEDSRPPTADVRLKEANTKFVHGALILKLKSVLGIRDRDKSLIRQRLMNWVSDVEMGDEVQFSDVTVPLMEETGAQDEAVVDYINLPFQFIVTENNSKYIFYCLSKEQRSLLDHFTSEKVFLGELFEKYKDYITVYDFFDILYALIFDRGFNEAIGKLEMESYEWGKKIEAIRIMRDMTIKSLLTKKLSPVRSETLENEYFELGDAFIYEDREYTKEEWEKSLNILYSLSLGGAETTEDYQEMYSLAVYCMTIVYILTTQEDLTGSRNPLYTYLTNILSGTPIEFLFNA